MRLIRSEFLKLRTTNGWWLFLLGALLMLVLAILFNWLQADFAFSEGIPQDIPEDDADTFEASRSPIFQAANLYTSGQFFGLMFVMLVGIVIVTSEFQHQTATTTFLTTPHRTAVILAKLCVAALFGATLWLVSLAINVPATIGILSIYDQSSLLGEWPAQRAILLNLLAYALWGVLGVGLGVLIRSQIAATVTATVLYLIGTTAVTILVTLLQDWLGWEWIDEVQYAVPSVASTLMVSGTSLPGQPPYWVGAVILVGWAVVTGTIGTMITRRRDVS
ncbi:MAG: ABC transporter permease subunit [Micromonosporaceae bacterium]|nr:ABC transporter permease subunit [Micromonosporaceae bacterium]